MFSLTKTCRSVQSVTTVSKASQSEVEFLTKARKNKNWRACPDDYLDYIFLKNIKAQAVNSVLAPLSPSR